MVNDTVSILVVAKPDRKLEGLYAPARTVLEIGIVGQTVCHLQVLTTISQNRPALESTPLYFFKYEIDIGTVAAGEMPSIDDDTARYGRSNSREQ